MSGIWHCVDALSELAEEIFAASSVVRNSRVKAWRCREGRAFLELCPDDRDVARMIARRFLLFVGVLVFFIDDDEAEILERREDCAARADDDAGAAGVELVPFVVPLAFGEMAVKNGDHIRVVGEAALEALDGLRSERDFRHENDRAFAAREGGADRLQINFRLAAAGDAVQEDRRMSCRIFQRASRSTAAPRFARRSSQDRRRRGTLRSRADRARPPSSRSSTKPRFTSARRVELSSEVCARRSAAGDGRG